MIVYRAMLDVPRELASMVAGLLRAERRARGTRRRSRALTCWFEAVLVLVWYRRREEMTVLAAGFGISRSTAYRYRDEVVKVLRTRGARPARGAGRGPDSERLVRNSGRHDHFPVVAL